MVKTEDFGIRRLFCVEAPEIWFFDFVKVPRGETLRRFQIDPVFMQTVEKDTMFVQSVFPPAECRLDGDHITVGSCYRPTVVTVFGVRKGCLNTRFTKHTEEQFNQNLIFWNQQFDE